MANCIISRVRTNYFGVTDMEGFQKEIRQFGIIPNEGVKDQGIIFQDDENKVGFALDCSCVYAKQEDENTLIDVIQKYINQGDACIITEIGYEACRYIYGTATIVTAEKLKVIDLDDYSKAAARALLGNSAWDTQMG